MRDYAKTDDMDFWLRHPVLGDPSFDTFERVGDTVHRSEPPYEWAVNGSLFRDFDDSWYYYAGLYPYGYRSKKDERSFFKIYRSKDRGNTWEDLGKALEDGFRFEGDTVNTDGGPDAVVCYDPKEKKYLLTYDNATNDFSWETAHDPQHAGSDSGAALVWGDTPKGPFTRLPQRFLSMRRIYGTTGRFDRVYGSTVLPRKEDYIAFCLCDSGEHYAWGLVVMTAPKPEGPWSMPHVILSCDRPEYYPCPLEFHPVWEYQGTVYANATSVAGNRNYQGVFAAPLEQAHDPSAWKLLHDGNVWHARNHPDEYYGIWGQTFHGFVEPDTGRYVVMFPSKDQRNYGTLSVAARPWDTPYSDGFTMTAHVGPSLSPILNSYSDFRLEAEFVMEGCVDVAFDYHGILGPDDSTADSVPADTALRGYTGVRITAKECTVLSLDEEGNTVVHGKMDLEERTDAGDEMKCSLWMERKGNHLSVGVNGKEVFDGLYTEETEQKARPLALILASHSRISCTRFAVEGKENPYTLCYHAADALLGAGQLHPDKEEVSLDQRISPNRWHRTRGGYVGEGAIAAKWNVIGKDFEIPFEKHPSFGKAGIWVDGCFAGTVDLCGEGSASWQIKDLKMGRHGIMVRPYEGKIAISKIYISGDKQDL